MTPGHEHPSSEPDPFEFFKTPVPGSEAQESTAPQHHPKTDTPKRSPTKKTLEKYRYLDSKSFLERVVGDLQLTADDNVPKLQHGISKVVREPGVHLLKMVDSADGAVTYNFHPYIENIPLVSDVKLEAISSFVPATDDQLLQSLAKEHRKKFVVSTSSITGILSKLYLKVLKQKPVNLDLFSDEFKNMKSKFTTTVLERPVIVDVHYNDYDQYVLLSKKDVLENDSKLLSEHGHVMEALLTNSIRNLEALKRTSDETRVTDIDESRLYHFVEMENFLMRSQIDCWDSHLPRQKLDIKARALEPIRLDPDNYKAYLHHKLVNLTGTQSSFEFERFQCARSTMLKYMFQSRIGDMDGVIICYHNIEKIFGFEYLSRKQMSEYLCGSEGMMEQIFVILVKLIDRILRQLVRNSPKKSFQIGFSFAPRSNKLTIFRSPINDAKPKPKDIQIYELDIKPHLNGNPISSSVIDFGNPDEDQFSIEYALHRLEMDPLMLQDKFTSLMSRFFASRSRRVLEYCRSIYGKPETDGI
ncbi:mitochondrial protein Pet127-domain-containing protein [Polychytrium aggregatum]|uniref:mitochondrial protein Pet127-domain-containing protein n=1 Tax=Polychytrium aggregatum TaxID=110093 RepID=UPI0022FE664C|nr:mitochondrial protein Pet127-domain-containing protein [Polychytrium aggregatum]KAI9209810.1 mitochondrial protein Pet127-domain-containing protein [Polychytrium aggregatum]